jgi:hypothetical protein
MTLLYALLHTLFFTPQAIPFPGPGARSSSVALADVQAKGNNPGFGAITTVAVTMTSTMTAGNAVVCGVWWLSTSVTLTSVADTANTYTVINNTVGSSWSASSVYAKNLSAASTITATFSGSVNRAGISCREFSGASTSAPLDTSAINSQSFPGTGTDALTSTSFTTTGTGDYIWGATYDTNANSPTFTAGTGFSGGSLATGTGAAASGPYSEYKIQSAAGSIAATFTSSVSLTIPITMGASFKP